ncbi:hypothetical protein HPB50_007215 [Hyalomma asiaticum]|uniref:Uncharacterized protein n=1 Tax=Hyalomma asiaticum TaxID=266040 RepID=A0ACB7S7M6_HYAAI|nr:hypothetical protein HPB50_007215 [Hyalomma asiaticum]
MAGSTIPTGTEGSTPIHCTLLNPRTPNPFRGAIHDDVEDWLVHNLRDLGWASGPLKLRNTFPGRADPRRCAISHVSPRRLSPTRRAYSSLIPPSVLLPKRSAQLKHLCTTSTSVKRDPKKTNTT